VKNKFIFFTFNDFSKDGGGRVRIYGILNALAKKEENEVILISNKSNNIGTFHSSIKHHYFGLNFSENEKRIFQFLLAYFPNFINKLFFYKYLKKFKDNIPYKENIIFCEYLDNSFGYFLKKNNIIDSYINDTHGIAPLEFKFNRSKGIKRIYNFFRYLTSLRLDYKVLFSVKKLIVVSGAMKMYFLENYPFSSKRIVIVPDGVSDEFCSQQIDKKLLTSLQKKYCNSKKNIFFAGNFKDLGGILDLIEAYVLLRKKRDDIKLLLIGDGEHFNKSKDIIKKSGLEDDVIFFGRIPYNKLKTYQQLADVIVCPDKAHPYSNMIVHIKYYDSLASGKIVINGDFDSIREININEELSLLFEPSNIEDLSKKIDFALDNIESLNDKYKNVAQRVCNDFSYSKFVSNLNV